MNLLEQNEQRKVEKLAQILDKREIEKNRTTLQELSEFRVLFKRTELDELDEDQLSTLSDRFTKRFDIYRPIEVYGSDGEVLFRIPQLFTPLTEIRDEYSSLVNRFHRDSTSDVPKYAAEATRGLMAAILKSQQDGATENGFDGYLAYVRDLNEEYRSDVNQFNELRTSERTSEKVSDPDPTPSKRDRRSGADKKGGVSIDSVDALSWD